VRDNNQNTEVLKYRKIEFFCYSQKKESYDTIYFLFEQCSIKINLLSEVAPKILKLATFIYSKNEDFFRNINFYDRIFNDYILLFWSLYFGN